MDSAVMDRISNLGGRLHNNGSVTSVRAVPQRTASKLSKWPLPAKIASPLIAASAIGITIWQIIRRSK